MLLTFSLFLLYIRKLRWSFSWWVVAVTAFPLLETIPLLEHDTEYGFGRLKWLVPLILAFVLLGRHFLEGGKRRAAILVGVVALVNTMNALLYLDIYFWSK